MNSQAGTQRIWCGVRLDSPNWVTKIVHAADQFPLYDQSDWVRVDRDSDPLWHLL